MRFDAQIKRTTGAPVAAAGTRIALSAALILVALVVLAYLVVGPHNAFAEDDDELTAGTFDAAVSDVLEGDELADDPSASSPKMLKGDGWLNIDDIKATDGAADAASADATTQKGDGFKAIKNKLLKESGLLNTTIDENGVVSAAVFPFLPNPTTEQFIGSIAEPAREIGQKYGLYASVMIAQAILESGSGSSGLSKPPYNNLFGIKGSYKGATVVMMTSEDDGAGNKYDIADGFRRYPSVKESLEDYADLLTRSMGTFYAPAWKANAKTYVEACNYLQGHYATDTSYSGKLQGIILAYDLVQYDHPASWAKSDEGRKEKAKRMLMAFTLGGRALPTTQMTAEQDQAPSSDEIVTTSSLSSDASAQAAARSESAKKAAEVRKELEHPLSNPGVQISLLSLIGITALFAKSEIALLGSALAKALAKLVLLVR